MKEIVRVNLENEMDLILAHKRTMKLCELTGFSLLVQTSLATAVSEISRCAIDYGTNATLVLGIDTQGQKKYIKATIYDGADFLSKAGEACSYAKRLVDDMQIVRSPKDAQIILRQNINFGGTLTEAKIGSFVEYFKKEPPLSAYDELRRKNIQLQDLAEKLKESESNYRVLTDNLPLMMFSVNNRGQITYSNKWLLDYFSHSLKELNSVVWASIIHPQDYPGFSKDIAAMQLKSVPLSGQYRFKHKSTGQFLWHMISIIPLKNEKDIVSGWIGFVVDINTNKLAEQAFKDNKELKETQQTLFRYQEELERKVFELNRSNYELEQFAHLASHDLQEPLRKLFFYSDVLKKKYASSLDSSGVNMLNNMTQAAGRMKELIGDLLSYSQLHQQKFVFETIDLNGVMKDVLRDLEVSIKEKGAQINVAELPTIKGHRIRLQQLFTNLVSNALKYSKKDIAPTVTIECHQIEQNVQISVTDNGIGFEQQYSDKIFGLFERLHTRDQFPGTGIGLSICKRIAELHGGTISATSRVNEFSKFDIVLPLEQPEQIAIEI